MTHTSPIAYAGESTNRAEAVAWLAGRVRWEHLLTELRDTSETVDDRGDVRIDEAA